MRSQCTPGATCWVSPGAGGAACGYSRIDSGVTRFGWREEVGVESESFPRRKVRILADYGAARHKPYESAPHSADERARRDLQHRRPRARVRRDSSRHPLLRDRKSTRLNSSHLVISYAVFCLKKK